MPLCSKVLVAMFIGRSLFLLQLDEKAQIFLKNLLDGATERVFEGHSKVRCHNYFFHIALLDETEHFTV